MILQRSATITRASMANMTFKRAAGLAACVTLVVGSATCSSSTTNPSDTFSLTVNNFLSWCSLSVTAPANTTLPSGATAASNKLTVAKNAVVSLHGEPTTGFIWAPSVGKGGWSGEIDAGQNTIGKNINVTMSGNKTIGVCCPFPDGSGC